MILLSFQRLARLAALICIWTFAASPLSVQAHDAIQPTISVGTDGIGLGAYTTLKSGDEVHLDASFANFNSNGNGTYIVTGAGGANPVTLNLSLSEQVKFGDIGLTYDHYLKKNKPLYLSAGFVANLLSADADTIPTQSTLIFNNQSYSEAQLGELQIHARWRVIDPYFGVGWNAKNAQGHTHGVRVDVGIYTLGTPTVSFTTDQFIAANPQIFGPYLDSLRGTLVHDLSSLTIYPVLRISIPVGNRH